MHFGRNVVAALAVALFASFSLAAAGCAGARVAAIAPVSAGSAGDVLAAATVAEWPGDDAAAFSVLDPVAARLAAPADAGEEAAALAHLAAVARGADVAPWAASARDLVTLHRIMALADAARWTARALWRAHHPGVADPTTEAEAADAIAAAYLRELEPIHPAVAWYSIRLAAFLERTGAGADAAFARRLRAPSPPLADALARWLGHPPAATVAVL